MSNRPTSRREIEIPESSRELKLLVGLLALGALSLVVFAVGWAVSAGSPDASVSPWIHAGWLEFTQLIRGVFTMVLAGAVVVGAYLITLGLGGVVLVAWRRLRSPY